MKWKLIELQHDNTLFYMRASIVSAVIGELQQDERFPDWWRSNSIPVPFFDNEELPVTFMDFIPEDDLTFLSDADNALLSFLAKDASERELVSPLVHDNLLDFAASVGSEDIPPALRSIDNIHDIWKFVYPLEISVSRRHRRDKDIYIHIGCNCEWEEEHGLQLVFRRGMAVTRVSAIDGHLTDADAYDIPDGEDQLLSQFSNAQARK